MKSVNLWFRHYKTKEKNDFHLPVFKIPARQHSQFSQIQAEWAVLPSWYFENGEMKINFFFDFIMSEP